VVSLQVDPDSVIKRFNLGVVTATVDATRDELCRLLSSPDLREEFAARGRQYVASHHSEEVVVKAFDQATGRTSES